MPRTVMSYFERWTQYFPRASPQDQVAYLPLKISIQKAPQLFEDFDKRLLLAEFPEE